MNAITAGNGGLILLKVINRPHIFLSTRNWRLALRRRCNAERVRKSWLMLFLPRSTIFVRVLIDLRMNAAKTKK
ncbi:hypothetical protein ASD00_29235 [Ensifer sp. Root31]|nr:hypothetical protein ASD00_29235 [Ensifer sp. Root31]